MLNANSAFLDEAISNLIEDDGPEKAQVQSMGSDHHKSVMPSDVSQHHWHGLLMQAGSAKANTPQHQLAGHLFQIPTPIV
jgi:hypothetical protein